MKVTIYGRKEGCHYCNTAKQICEDNKFSYTFLDLAENNISKEDLAELCGTPVSSVPQIFVDDVYIKGGCTGFINYLKNKG